MYKISIDLMYDIWCKGVGQYIRLKDEPATPQDFVNDMKELQFVNEPMLDAWLKEKEKQNG